jgi:hypothetical protein
MIAGLLLLVLSDLDTAARLYDKLFERYVRPMPAVRDLTRDGRWIIYDVSVHKLYNVPFRVKCARRGQPLNLPSPTKLARPSHFPPASQSP